MNKMKNNLINATSSVWDGSAKSFTKLCSECDVHREIDNESRCYWGVAYKVLDKTKILSYCQLIGRPSPRKERLMQGVSQS
jgi:hypothetical protein